MKYDYNYTYSINASSSITYLIKYIDTIRQTLVSLERGLSYCCVFRNNKIKNKSLFFYPIYYTL